MIGLLERLAGRPLMLRGFAALMISLLFLFLIDSLLIYGFDMPGFSGTLQHLGILDGSGSTKPLSGSALTVGLIQLAAVAAILFGCIVWVRKSANRTLLQDARLYDGVAGYIIRAAFWSVFLVGAADVLISFLRVEDFLAGLVGEHLTTQLGRSIFRGTWVHFPLIGISLVIAYFNRSIGFIWLALMIVAAEFLIVITRFVFSYEQAFMGDLVRFWYAALFLFASAYTLMNDGHVRVDVLYAGFSERGKAVTNTIGSLLFGLPICWTILVLGTASRGSIIVSPLMSFEISQSGFGMYTKYLMAGYLMIFALSMAIQFVSFFLSNMAKFKANEAAEMAFNAAQSSPGQV